MEDLIEEKELDEAWIKDFEKDDEKFKIFYSDDVYYIKLHCIYIDKMRNIKKIKEDKIFMNSPNYISKEEILGIFKRHSLNDGINYSILSILKYNINMEPLDVKNFVKTNDPVNDYSFLVPINNINAIPFDKTISMFQDLNNLFIIFFEKDKTHKIINHNATKKVYFFNTHKKTIKKAFIPLKI